MMKEMQLLGLKARDAVTGFEGVVESISYDLYGCIQAVIRPGLDEKGQVQDGRWFDTKRLIVTSDAPVMSVPSFEKVPGGSEKPAKLDMPAR